MDSNLSSGAAAVAPSAASAAGAAAAPPATTNSPGQQRARKRQKTTTTPPALSPHGPPSGSVTSSHATSPAGYSQSHIHGHGQTPEDSQLSSTASGAISRGNAGSPRSTIHHGLDSHNHSRHSSGDGEAMLHNVAGGGGNNGGSGEKGHVKRACNECRQQKLRCDVVQNPYTICSRCRRLKLECKIDANFKRTVKRSKIAEMEKELSELRQKLAAGSPPGGLTSPQAPPSASYAQHAFSPHAQISQPLLDASASAMSSFHTSNTTTQPDFEHNTSPSRANDSTTTTQPERLTDGVQNGSNSASASGPKGTQVLEDIVLNADQIGDLFNEYFAHYHPFLPFLDPEEPPGSYHEKSRLLFWAIISIASRRYTEEPTLLLRLSRAVSKLVWSTLASIPHSKDVVKGLILLATWPFPTSSTLTDPTYMISCMAVSVGIQMGLHRPSHGKDYTKYASKAKIGEVEVNDRTNTWACCNVASQSVSTGLGLPPHTQYDWTLLDSLNASSKHTLSPSLKTYLRIQRFADEVTRALSTNALDPIGLLGSEQRRPVIAVLERRADEMEGELYPLSELHRIYLLCARLHLRAFHLFDEPNTPNYQARILSLYAVATTLVQHVLQVETNSGSVLSYCPFYVYQMFLSASFILLKVLHSSVFRPLVDYEVGRALFNQTITAIRRISVANNDLPGRLADVLAQLSTSSSAMNSGGGGSNVDTASNAGGERIGGVHSAPGSTRSLEDKIGEDFQLRIRSRMSMSVVYDSLWKWREEFQQRSTYLQAREELGATNMNSEPPPSFDPNPPSSKPPATYTPAYQQVPATMSSGQPLTAELVAAVPSAVGVQGIPTTMLPMDMGRELTPILSLPTTGPAPLDMDMSPLIENDFLNMNWMLDGYEFLPMPGVAPLPVMPLALGVDPMKVDMDSMGLQ